MSFQNIKIDNGKIDINYLNNRLKDKRQLYREITILQIALRQAKIKISTEPRAENRMPIFTQNGNNSYEWVSHKSKYFYNLLLSDIVVSPTSETYWLEKTNITEEVLQKSYIIKVKEIRDKKLSETNFKILNNILPCNRNLLKWGKSDTKLCSFCQVEESISHLLYHCQYAQSIWNLIQRALVNFDCDINISHDLVIFGDSVEIALNYVVSVVVYYIYREWLQCSFENKQRKQHLCLKALTNYLRIRQNTYMQCSNPIWHAVCAKLEILILYIENGEIR